MKKRTIKIRLEIESDELRESLAKFYQEILTQYEGTDHKTNHVEIVVDGAFMV